LKRKVEQADAQILVTRKRIMKALTIGTIEAVRAETTFNNSMYDQLWGKLRFV
jgi:hypothetical protein